MKEIIQSLKALIDRVIYLEDIKGPNWAELSYLHQEFELLRAQIHDLPEEEVKEKASRLESHLSLLEKSAAEVLSPWEIVKIVRNPQRFTLQDILENVYDHYTELGGEGEINIDPAVVVARATISRMVKGRVYNHQVMVIGHEKGQGEEYRNGGCAKPWGNEKALRYMKVAETEGIPIHFYIFTPGSYPIEDYPGAAQQIARNLYFMAKLRVPTISFISEGGSGGAEAIGLTDLRLMGSRGYYSVISPEGAAAIEAKLKEGQKASPELLEWCARQLKLTAEDNLKLGTIDRIVPEPPLGARREDFRFFKRLRYEIIRATDEVVLKTKSFKAFRAYALERKKEEADPPEEFDVHISWELSETEVERLLDLRSKKYRQMATWAYKEAESSLKKCMESMRDKASQIYYEIRYGILKTHQKQVQKILEDVSSEATALLSQVTEPIQAVYDVIAGPKRPGKIKVTEPEFREEWGELYVSPIALEDRTVSCPNAARYGCQDIWVPDLYGEFCGVCPNCGHHFPLEYDWYLRNLFDPGSIREFNEDIASTNPLGYEGFDKKLQQSIKKTGRRSGMLTFHAQINGLSLIVAMLIADFRQGTVGAAEGEKFVRAIDKARVMRRPFLAYIHTTGGIRIHEGTIGVIQMPKCTMAVREYVDAGGLYIVVYDNNSYAGPVASFLGSAPYQFAIRSSRIGFAGPRVIRETTGDDVPPDYHSATNALRRGHIQGIWDRREFRKNLYDALIRMGGKNLYYR
ncbi:acetyl-CoA carboxylase carboxyl transferase subunit alpha/beta [Thermosulfuriphilus sp.]